MKNYFLGVAGFLGASGVALGAFGAHFLKAKMLAGLITADQLSAFDTATKYQLFHALALLFLFFINKDNNLKWFNISAKLFITGILLFSGSLYLLTTRNLTGIEALSFLGPITPIGGLFLVGGWIGIMVQAFQFNKINT